jgi:ABC-2 type transport system permease protein
VSGEGSQIRALSRRSIARSVRQPVLVVPGLVFPLFMLAVLSSAGKKITDIPDFPTHSYITFIIAATLIQGAASACTVAGNAMGNDVETGFLSRIAVTPAKVPSLLIANLAGVALLGFLESVLYLVVGLLAGASVKAGFAGAVVAIAIVVVIVLAFGAVGLFLAIRTGSAMRAQGGFVLIIGLLFLSSMMMPRNLITATWFKDIATYNPMSYLVEAPRSLFISGWDTQALALGLGIATALLVLFLAGAARGLRASVMKK